VLAGALVRAGHLVERQRPIDIEFEGELYPAAFRADLVIDGRVLIEVKSIERLQAVHAKQLLTYLRLTRQPVGLLINFGGATLMEGFKSLVNNY
jgi:iron complex transport system substrate-binding protein